MKTLPDQLNNGLTIWVQQVRLSMLQPTGDQAAVRTLRGAQKQMPCTELRRPQQCGTMKLKTTTSAHIQEMEEEKLVISLNSFGKNLSGSDVVSGKDPSYADIAHSET